MIAVIDTSSLLALARYYMPFDHDGKLVGFIRQRVIDGEIVIIDRVMQESRYIAQGTVVKAIPFLGDKAFLKSNKPLDTEDMLPPKPKRFMNQLDNQFVIGVMRNRLTAAELEAQKTAFMRSADMGLVLTCLNRKRDLPMEHTVLVTEETEVSNDNKLFHKIPAICKIVEIECSTLPQLLEGLGGVDISFNVAK